ncbi:unnamed protein product [Caenorhabditis bovis]|uniref:Uncharacterized protein n=1 Tax=Caenorhabditis bovis TaxID=2654633 RepID=A0A8S1EJA5_9PELO|nr:unnamed protein product [Caenorhabditis bovis]
MKFDPYVNLGMIKLTATKLQCKESCIYHSIKFVVQGKECIPDTNVCFQIVDSYMIEFGQFVAKRDLVLSDFTEYSLTGVEIEPTKPLSWENVNSREWPVNKLVINARYARLLIAAGFFMESMTFDENEPKKVLIAGLGGGVISNFLGEVAYLNIKTTVVEIEPKIIEIAEKYFDHEQTADVNVIQGDIHNVLDKKIGDERYNLIIIDACENRVADIMCPSVLTRDFVKNVKDHLEANGTVAVNIFITSDHDKNEKMILKLYETEFDSCFFMEYMIDRKVLICTPRKNWTWDENKKSMHKRLEEVDDIFEFQLHRFFAKTNEFAANNDYSLPPRLTPIEPDNIPRNDRFPNLSHESKCRYAQKVKAALQSMEMLGLQSDPRYYKMKIFLAQFTEEKLESFETPPRNGKVKFTDVQMKQLKAQIAVYHILKNNAPLSQELRKDAISYPPQEPYVPGSKGMVSYLNYFEKFTQITRELPFVKRDAIDFGTIPARDIQKEKDLIIRERLKEKAKLIERNLNRFPPEMQTKAKIEMRALRLVGFQAQVRDEAMAYVKKVIPKEFLLNPYSIRRSKEEYQKELKGCHWKMVLEKQRRQKNNNFLHALVKHAREFKDFHKQNMAKHNRVRKQMTLHHQSIAREKKRDEMRNEKLRIQKLIQEDEEGYRAMLDEKKDQRLVYLLQQTDVYIDSLCTLVKKHQGHDDPKEPSLMERRRDEFAGLDAEEKAKKILEKARQEEDEYEVENPKDQMENYYATAHQTREVITEQHSMMGEGDPNLRLKPYQIKGLEWLVSLYNNNLNGILADEMGLGKTIQTISFITYLMQMKRNIGPYLVIVPLSTISNWFNEFIKWAPKVQVIVYKGNKDCRKATEPAIKSGKFHVLLTTFEYVLKEKALLSKLRWKYMIIDEGHRLKNSNCKLTSLLNTHFQTQHRLLITGTPLQNKLPELWALLNFLLPTIFSSCGTFEQWFNAPFATTGEKVELTDEETMLIIRRLHKVLRPFLLRRLKKEVESQLPEKTEYIVKCDMSALQNVLYTHMQQGLLLDGKMSTGSKTLMNTMMHLRKLCNHPFLFPHVEESCRVFWNVPEVSGYNLMRVSGKLELLDRILPKLRVTDHRVLIFFQMTSMMTILEDYLTYRKYRYLRLDGSTKPDERGELLKKFNDPSSPYFLFLLSTRAGGLGLNLQTADTVILFDSDWNPHQDMQAQDRAHRIGQKQEVRVLRLVTANSVEEKILSAAKFKLNVDEKVIQAGKFDNRSTGEERKQMLEQIIRAEAQDRTTAEVPDDEAINDMLARTEEEIQIFSKMDSDRYKEEKRMKPRLLTQKEIPQDLLRASIEVKNQQKAKEEGKLVQYEVLPGSRRKRKEVDYSLDSMTDEQFDRRINGIASPPKEKTPPPPRVVDKEGFVAPFPPKKRRRLSKNGEMEKQLLEERSRKENEEKERKEKEELEKKEMEDQEKRMLKEMRKKEKRKHHGDLDESEKKKKRMKEKKAEKESEKERTESEEKATLKKITILPSSLSNAPSRPLPIPPPLPKAAPLPPVLQKEVSDASTPPKSTPVPPPLPKAGETPSPLKKKLIPPPLPRPRPIPPPLPKSVKVAASKTNQEEAVAKPEKSDSQPKLTLKLPSAKSTESEAAPKLKLKIPSSKPTEEDHLLKPKVKAPAAQTAETESIPKLTVKLPPPRTTENEPTPKLAIKLPAPQSEETEPAPKLTIKLPVPKKAEAEEHVPKLTLKLSIPKPAEAESPSKPFNVESVKNPTESDSINHPPIPKLRIPLKPPVVDQSPLRIKLILPKPQTLDCEPGPSPKPEVNSGSHSESSSGSKLKKLHSKAGRMTGHPRAGRMTGIPKHGNRSLHPRAARMTGRPEHGRKSSELKIEPISLERKEEPKPDAKEEPNGESSSVTNSLVISHPDKPTLKLKIKLPMCEPSVETDETSDKEKVKKDKKKKKKRKHESLDEEAERERKLAKRAKKERERLQRELDDLNA